MGVGIGNVGRQTVALNFDRLTAFIHARRNSGKHQVFAVEIGKRNHLLLCQGMARMQSVSPAASAQRLVCDFSGTFDFSAVGEKKIPAAVDQVGNKVSKPIGVQDKPMGVLRSVKAAQNFRESVFINQTANADMEDLPLPASDLSSRLDPLVPVLLQTNSLLVEHPSGRSELRAISGFEQGKPYFLFQTFDLVGNGRLAQIQFFIGLLRWT